MITFFKQVARLLQIQKTMVEHFAHRHVLGEYSRGLRIVSFVNPWRRRYKHQTRGVAIRLAFEKLGPIFIKLGQMISVRHDLLPDDVLAELSKLQDNVPPFSEEEAVRVIEHEFKKPVGELFKSFTQKPLGSASVAQVHVATLTDDSDVVVKIIRPHIKQVIRKDVGLMLLIARLAERFWKHGKRLRLVALVREFEQTIFDELDLTREAANASLLRRNFEGSDKMSVPKIYWKFVTPRVMVMERVYGVPISDLHTLKAHGTDMKKLAEYGVDIFFTQVFRDCFFHADMHPGNLFVDISDPKFPRYIGVDFGIMGTLTPEDQHYLASNLLAFFRRDYRRVALLHIESGWVSKDTRVDQFESAIRTVCEPIFEQPLADISFGLLLLQLFNTAERFNMSVQPQLMLLQKTLLNIESLGRQLYPELDLWNTAKPFMEKWMRERRSPKRLLKQLCEEWPELSTLMIQLPKKLLAWVSREG